MNPTSVPASASIVRRSNLNRADLVYWLKRDNSHAAMLKQAAGLIGFEPRLEMPSVGFAHQPPVAKPDTRQTPQSNVDVSPTVVPDVKFFRVASREGHDADRDSSNELAEPLSIRGVGEFKPAELTPASDKPLGLEPLIRWARLWPVLKRHLHTQRQSAIDIPGLIKHIAAGRTVRRLPLLQRLRWASRIVVLMDGNPRLGSFQGDFDRLCEALKDLVGKFNLDARIIAGIPGGDCVSWEYPGQEPRHWDLPPANTPVLILSDLGMLDRLRSPSRRLWLRFGRQLKAAGLLPIVLAPVSPGHVDPELSRFFHIVLWTINSRLKRQAHGRELDNESQVQQLLALLSPAVRIEPALLRAVRHLLPADQFDAGCEADFWLHPDVQVSLLACGLRDEETTLQCHRAAFARQPEHLQRRIIDLLRQHHAPLFPAVRHEETLIWASLVAPQLAVEYQAEIDEANCFMRKMARMLYVRRDHPDALQEDFGRRHVDRSHTTLRTQQVYYSVVEGIVNRDNLENGLVVRPGIDRDELKRTLASGNREIRHCTLYQLGPALIIAENEVDGTEEILVNSRCADLRVVGDSLFIEQKLDHGLASEVYMQLTELPKTLAVLTPETKRIQLRTEFESLTISATTKPAWARTMGRDGDGLFVEFDLRGAVWSLYWPQWGADLDYDDYGLHADLRVKNTIQRFRWINPGMFQMGSPESEAEREDDETPHEVPLMRGYWLADTACTQALWRAVMGDSPARFSDDENRPVEQVSWLHVQQFINKLNALVPGLQADFPTEAQWERACRAGTPTPFSFGRSITPEQVNYNAEYLVADGEKGVIRGTTVPVKSLPANAWGLYEMHGNVFEWCRDWYGDYPEEAVSDPKGLPNGASRVLRGGSWIDGARIARSAFRSSAGPARRNGYFGFRLALGQAASGEQEVASGAAADGRSRSGAGQRQARDGPVDQAPGWLDRIKEWMGRNK